MTWPKVQQNHQRKASTCPAATASWCLIYACAGIKTAHGQETSEMEVTRNPDCYNVSVGGFAANPHNVINEPEFKRYQNLISRGHIGQRLLSEAQTAAYRTKTQPCSS